MFTWAIGEGLCDHSPVTGTNKATDEVSRDRVLTNDELRSVWNAAGTGDYGDIIRLLILTGQRREEVGGMLWSELDVPGATWRIGSDRTKNGIAHEVPLSSEALRILGKRRRSNSREFVFGTGEGPFQGWSGAKRAIDRRAGLSSPWRLHDLRRTVATRMADLGVPPHIVESILNLVSGHKAGVAGVYNRSTYAAEKKAALSTWCNFIVGELQPGDSQNG